MANYNDIVASIAMAGHKMRDARNCQSRWEVQEHESYFAVYDKWVGTEDERHETESEAQEACNRLNGETIR